MKQSPMPARKKAMKQTGFSRGIVARAQREPRDHTLSMQALVDSTLPRPKSNYGGTSSGEAIEKEKPARSPAYRKVVASLPCVICLRAPCQAAHPNVGKGMAIKTDDRLTFPMCPDHHRELDQGAMLTKSERRVAEPAWGAATRAYIMGMGLWPRGLPLWPGDLG